jgi:hypothetical protein
VSSPADSLRDQLQTTLGATYALEREGALRWLARSIDGREAIAATYAVSCEPMFDALKSDPRFAALMQRMRVRVCPSA